MSVRTDGIDVLHLEDILRILAALDALNLRDHSDVRIGSLEPRRAVSCVRLSVHWKD